MFKLLALLASLASAQQGTLGLQNFWGLNDTDSPATVDTAQSPDLLNTESNLAGTAILKRRGFSREAAFTVSTAAITGATKFTDSNGNVQRVVCHDRYCAKSTNGNAYSNFLSTAGGTGSVPTRWSFVNIGGTLYGANDSRDPIMSWDGTTLSYPVGPPAGSLLELTDGRLVVADTSANPNRLAYSNKGTYTLFTTGVNSVDPWTDDMGAPGDRTTAMKYDRGRLYVFKRQSITVGIIGDQYTTPYTVISNNVGTQDPLSLVSAPDGLYFTASDGGYWRVNENGLTLISQKISNFVKNKLSGALRSNTQTTQADWNAGTQVPAASWNTTTNPGSMFNSSATIVDTSSSDFVAGTMVNLSTAINGELFFVQPGSATFLNASIETDGTTNWPSVIGFSRSNTGNSGFYGTWTWKANADALGTGNSTNDPFARVYVLDVNGSTVTTFSPPTLFNGMSPTQYTFDVSTQPIKTMALHIQQSPTHPSASGYEGITTGYFIRPSSVVFVMGDYSGSGFGLQFDLWEPPSFSTYAQFTSQYFDTSFTTPTWGPMTVTVSSIAARSTGASITFQTKTSNTNDGLGQSALQVLTNGAAPLSPVRRYLVYQASWTVTASTVTNADFYDATLVAATTGQFVTQCIQPSSSITSWGILSCAQTLTGNGSLTFASTSAATCVNLSSATGPWTAISNNATVNVATNTAFAIRITNLLTSATDQAQLDACTVYWQEGSAAQPVNGVYNPINNSIYWTATTTASTQGDRVLKYDLNLYQFYPFDLRATSLLFDNNTLYFGSSTGGYWNKYGSVDSDNGSNINAWWKSKDFAGASAFQETTYQSSSIVARNQSAGTLTETVGLSNALSFPHTISMSTTSTISYIRDNYRINLASPQSFVNIKFQNNSAVTFEVLGLKIDYFSSPWRVLNP